MLGAAFAAGLRLDEIVKLDYPKPPMSDSSYELVKPDCRRRFHRTTVGVRWIGNLLDVLASTSPPCSRWQVMN
jgi:hypothetical protein